MPIEKIISFLLYPIAFLYASIALIKRYIALINKKDYGIKIISIGNLSIGGSGKTPFLISLIKKLKIQKTAIILRGYKRDSNNMLIVSDGKNIKCTVQESGDEAMLYAKSLNTHTVIVSKDRALAIKKAKSLNINCIFLDDAFSKANIKKFDILLEPNDTTNKKPLPSGAMREFLFVKNQANLILKEDIDYKRIVKVPKINKNSILITSISKPYRLNAFLKQDIKKVYFPDHSLFTKKEIINICEKHNASNIISTSKDYVKLQELNLEYDIFIIELDIDIKQSVFDEVLKYIS